MASTAVPQLRKGEQTAQRLAVVARDLFAERGYGAVSMREIALECGIGAGAIYNHYASKQDILMRILQSHMNALLEGLDASQSAAAAPFECLQRFVHFHIDYHADKSGEVFLSYMELRSLDADNFAAITALRQRYESALRGILQRGQIAGDFQMIDPGVSAKAILGMLSSLSHWYQDGGRLPAEDIKEIYWRMIEKSVRNA